MKPKQVTASVFCGLLPVVATIAAALCIGSVNAATYTVITVSNSQTGSLFAAIHKANSNAGPDVIVFDIPGGGVQTIAPNVPLPPITDPVEIDARTQPGYSTHPMIELSGAQNPSLNGLEIHAGGSGSIIRGLAINRWAGAGIFLTNTTDNLITSCFIGTDATGEVARPNYNGITAWNSTGTMIGSPDAPDRNVLSGNTGYGIIIIGGSVNFVVKNMIGTDKDGMERIGNGVGIEIQDASRNFIGDPMVEEAFNVISANLFEGIRVVNGRSITNYIRNNRIGTDVTGSAALGNGADGIFIGKRSDSVTGNASLTYIGTGLDNFGKNTIAGNGGSGVRIAGSTNNVILGNSIGTDGETAISNAAHGVMIHDNSSDNTIGGAEGFAANIIAGNMLAGILVNGSAETRIDGNDIGHVLDDSYETVAIPNRDGGVVVFQSMDTRIGGQSDEFNNYIYGNGGSGILVNQSTNTIMGGNQIGTALGNTNYGIWVSGSTGTQIGEPSEGGEATIGGNGLEGIFISHGSSNTQIRNCYIGVTQDLEPVPNGSHGITISGSTFTRVGGTNALDGNVIAANYGSGVEIIESQSHGPSTDNFLNQNLIGGEHGNHRYGVYVRGSSRNWIGGMGVLTGNDIDNNGQELQQQGHGVVIESGTNNAILGNFIRNNAGRGIDLGNDSFTLNDLTVIETDPTNRVVLRDQDAGANDLQNYPAPYAVKFFPERNSMSITWVLTGRSNAPYRVEWFRNATNDPSGFGEGQTFLGFTNVVLSGNGSLLFTKDHRITDAYLSATATDLEYFNTSEFSPIDTDGDGIADAWETIGIDINEDATVDYILTNANPRKKDLYVEFDSMVGQLPASFNDLLTKGTGGGDDGFNNAPHELIHNPDQSHGVTLHFRVDDINLPLQTNWAEATQWDAFDLLKTLYFGTVTERTDPNSVNILAAKALFYRYGISAYELTDNDSGGIAEIGGNDFIIYPGDIATKKPGFRRAYAGIVMHELGHCLGLYHGGDQPYENYKPNYYSIMNYAWQGEFSGNRRWRMDYSRHKFADLDEGNLDESVGLGGPRIYAKDFVKVGPKMPGVTNFFPLHGPADWNGNSNKTDTGEFRNLNGYDGFELLDVLTGHEDWSALRFYFLEDSDAVDGLHLDSVTNDLNQTELTEYEEYSTGAGIISIGEESFEIDESGTMIAIELVRTAENKGATVTVDYFTSNLTAIAGTDYTSVWGTVTFYSNEVVKGFSVPIINDSLAELTETFRVVITNAGGGATLGFRTEAVVTITDGDSMHHYSVTNNLDAGAGSLRQAILDANAQPGLDVIDFNIGAGMAIITPASTLPTISDFVILDGSTQPGFAGQPLIELIGTNAPGDGLTIAAGQCVVRGLAIHGFTGSGIVLTSQGDNRIEGCYVGLPISGDFGLGNGNGIRVEISSSRNVIGGTTTDARNIIAGNTTSGILLAGSENKVQGSWIGLNLYESPNPNGEEGILVEGTGNTIGGEAASERNIISGNGTDGIGLEGEENLVLGNFIGTDPYGFYALNNGGHGVAVRQGSGNRIGGTRSGAGNVIGGNTGAGIALDDASANTIQGNKVGTGLDQNYLYYLGNGGSGIAVLSGSISNLVGGEESRAANVIANNTEHGVHIASSSASGNVVRRNAMFDNTELGIKLGVLPGTTSNDPDDLDAGANDLQNFPVLTSATNTVDGTTVNGDLNSRSNTTYTIDFYANSQLDESGNAEGQFWIGTADVMTDHNGHAPFSADLPIIYIPGRYLTATATDPDGNTSELSPIVIADSTRTGRTFTVINTADEGDGSLRQAILDSNNETTSGNTILFNIPGSGVQYIYLSSPLPDIILPVLIDGYSQPGASPNTLASLSNNASLRITLNNSSEYGTHGLSIKSGNTLIRGLIIHDFPQSGIHIEGLGGNRIAGNIIGTDMLGNHLGNQGPGVSLLSTSNNIIGGTDPADQNIIAFNNAPGISVSDGTGNTILRNSLYSNALLGIDLDNDGITANDPGDADAGANLLQNYPILISAHNFGTNPVIEGTLSSSINTEYQLDFFANSACHWLGTGEGRFYLFSAAVTSDSNGEAAFSVVPPALMPVGHFLTATATDPDGNTSEFSPCTVITGTFVAITYHVSDSSGDDTNSGISWAEAKKTIQAAVDAAGDGDFVVVSNGVYATGGRVVHGAMTNRVAIDKALTVYSVNGPDVTIIEGAGPPGDAAVRCVYAGSNAVLIGFTLTHGATRTTGDVVTEQSGGGILCASSAVISNCLITGNSSASQGGGGYSGIYRNCVISDNEANSGGGTYLATLEDCLLMGNVAFSSGGGDRGSTLSNCLLRGNSATNGGGAYLSTLHGCTIESNRAFAAGGGTYRGTLHNCSIIRNRAQNGGGTFEGTIMGCAISENTAVLGGGSYQSSITNCTIVGNNGTTSGGGVYGGSLGHSIAYFNRSPDGANYDSIGDIQYSCITPLPGGMGNITNDPQLASLSHLSTNSPCLGAGISTNLIGTDIDGETWRSPPAMGCDEIHAGSITGLLVVTPSTSYTTVPVGLSVDFSAQVIGRTTSSEWNFGDGYAVTNQPFIGHGFSTTGHYDVVLRVYNETHPAGVAGTVTVQVIEQPVHFVDIANGTPVAPYTTWATAATNIQDAIDVASVGSLVLVSNGVYATGGRVMAGAMTNRIVVTNSLTVRSVNGPAVTIIAGAGPLGDAAVRCAYVGDNATLSGFTLTNGHTRTLGNTDTEKSGGGAWCENAGRLTDCIISGNAAAEFGGGSFKGDIQNSTFAGNRANSGGAAYSGLLQDCTLSENSALINGGGSYLGTLDRCTVQGNSAGFGGGGSYRGVIKNSAISGNTASNAGGGTYEGTINNCTITGNWTPLDGGGSYGGTLKNCIVYFNTAQGADSANYSDGSMLEYSCTIPHPGGVGNITQNPQLASFSRLSDSSPCAGAGNSAFATGTDIDGELWSDPPSMGCDEIHGGSITGSLSVVAVASDTNVAVGYDIRFTGLIEGHVTRSEWSFGDGQAVSNQPYISHAFMSTGIYAVVLRAFNESHPDGVAATVTVQVAQQVIHYVNLSNATPAAPYTSWETAATNIQNAVDVAGQPGALVLVSNGVYSTGSRIKGSTLTRVILDKAIEVRSVNGPAVTSIRGAGPPGVSAVRCAFVGANAQLSGFTLTNGHTQTVGSLGVERNGGGAWCESGAALSNCIITANSGASGGGVYRGTLNNCTLSGNTATVSHGGGAFGSVLNHCVLSGNTAVSQGGGAINSELTSCLIEYNSSIAGGGAAYSTLKRCTVSSNTASGFGGGLISSTAEQSILVGNTSLSGGGAFDSTTINCSVYGNRAAEVGGGAINGILNNCTIAGNSAGEIAGGVRNSTLNNCIVYFNSAPFAPNHDVSDLQYSCTTPEAIGTGNTTNDPLLASLSRLSTNSPCRGAGSSTFASGKDIDDESWNMPPSMGCDETHPGSITGALSVSASASTTNVAIGYEVDFTAHIEGKVVESMWSFGDGQTAYNLPIATHSFTTAGTYSATIRAVNESFPGGVTATVTVQVAEQAVHYVNKFNATPAFPYTSWATAATSIQPAIDAAIQVGALVLVSNGVYDTGGRVVALTLTNRVVIDKELTVRSVNGPSFTSIRGAFHPGATNGSAAIRCVYLGTNAQLIGFTLTNGATAIIGLSPNSDNQGGGAWCEPYSVMSNCVVTGNESYNGGGGVYLFYGTMDMCTVKGNGTYFGAGGVKIEGGTVNYSLILENRSVLGSGGASGGTLNHCLISSNRVVGSGGIGGSGGGAADATLNFCEIADNSARFDGGGAADSVLNNCLLVRNTAVRWGGGAVHSTLMNCTVVANSVSNYMVGLNTFLGEGGGVYNSTLTNCIVYANTALTSSSNHLSCTMTHCNTAPDPGGVGNVTAHPGFVAPHDFRLAFDSPCIDRGTNTPEMVGSVDLAGNPRVVNGLVDIGAYEYLWNGTGDHDMDGMPDFWEVYHGLNPEVSNSPTANADGDWMTDLEEYLADTDPTNSASSLSDLTIGASTAPDRLVIISQPSSTARVYELFYTTNLTLAPQTWQPVGPAQVGSGTSVSFTVTNDAPARSYRSGVRLP